MVISVVTLVVAVWYSSRPAAYSVHLSNQQFWTIQTDAT